MRLWPNLKFHLEERAGRHTQAENSAQCGELETGCYRFSMKFHDTGMEQGFAQGTSTRLIDSTFKLGWIICVGFSFALVLDVATGYFTNLPEGFGRTIEMTSSFCDMGLGVMGIAFVVVMKMQQRFNFATHLGIELVIISMCVVLVVVGVLSDRWYMGRFYGFEDPSAVVHRELSGTWLVLFLDMIITGTHIALPVRWSVLLPLEVFVAMVYPFLSLMYGSPHREASPAVHISLIILVVLSALGKRSLERLERMAFCNMISERRLRMQAEFRLSCMEWETPPKTESRASSVTAGSTTYFGDVDDAADLEKSLERLISFGRKEHWLVQASDLQVNPLRHLGSGGFGTVVGGAFHDSPVAIKVSKRPATWMDMQQLPELLNELRVLRRLRHPNIALFHGAVIDSSRGELAIVLELVDGSTLHEFAVTSTSDIDRYRVLVGVCRALQYLHGHQPSVVHGDLKSSNVMVEGFYQGTVISGGGKARCGGGVRAKLLDFGLARVLTPHAKPLGGTLHWMAPEVWRQDGNLQRGTATDVYSLGRLIHFTITGTIPWHGLSRSSVKRMLEAAEVPEVEWSGGSSLTQDCRELVDACLQLDPEARPTAADVHAHLKQLPESPERRHLAVHTDAPKLMPWGSGLSLMRDTQVVAFSVAGCQTGAGGRRQRELSPPASPSKVNLTSQTLPPVPEHDVVDKQHKFLETPPTTQLAMLLPILERWNSRNMNVAKCCDFHRAANLLYLLTQKLSEKPCTQLFKFCVDRQCSKCRVMLPLQDRHCDVCGTEAPVGSATQLPTVPEEDGAQQEQRPVVSL
eukprot:CAMPEP_0203886872 /NCGR_PEP_ID=MMETSP0359-20131031/30640_1 /ASSEMBLY_ACC=CAM_ASM_000338 /TAXON_ID=268821 /ORGANISM="Scrippsiella Hangoei, Strain SHTV-5" /LENGTH=803 /DNA_ID=CAMNT_0050807783 /DNA_START=112 /DNA_END=2523 /DNA_ORIENTATION=-